MLRISARQKRKLTRLNPTRLAFAASATTTLPTTAGFQVRSAVAKSVTKFGDCLAFVRDMGMTCEIFAVRMLDMDVCLQVPNQLYTKIVSTIEDRLIWGN